MENASVELEKEKRQAEEEEEEDVEEEEELDTESEDAAQEGGEETPSTTEYRFCKNACSVNTKGWKKKCGWLKCRECAPCVCTTIVPDNSVWTETTCQERCGAAATCNFRGRIEACAKYCSEGCSCGN